MIISIIISSIVILFFEIISYYVFIRFIKKLKISQNIRAEGPKQHYQKQGTPTLGGILIIIFTIIVFITFVILDKIINKKIDDFDNLLIKICFLLIPFLSYGLIGFVDDYLKIIKHHNEGLKAIHKFLLELIIGALTYFIYLSFGFDNTINFFGYYLKIDFLYGMWMMLLLTGFTNATNFTDGLDGLLGLTSITSFITIGILGYLKDNILVVYLALSVVIAICGFLVFNLNKANIFMGDVGSLAIGALMVCMLIMLKCELLIIFFGFIYLIEIFTVVLQVWFFKKTKGDRLFKMTPIHHHFEMKGYSEYIIAWLFCLVNLLFCIIGIKIGVHVII